MTAPLLIYWAVSLAVWLGLTAAVMRWRGAVGAPAGDTLRVAGIILLVALVARAAMVFTTTPLLSDDINRYVHDGWYMVEGEHPYALSPVALRERLDSEGAGTDKWRPSVEQINNPAMVTIYQPASQIAFGVMGVAAHATWRVVEPERLFRLGFAAVDMVVIALLLLALQQCGRSAWWAAIYAWHPLSVTETAWSGHQDVLGIAALLGAVWLTATLSREDDSEHLSRAQGTGWVVIVCAGLCFAAAVAVKPLVLPLALPLGLALVRQGRWRLLLAAVVGTVVGLAALYLPFALWEPGLGGMLQTVDTFIGKWASNGSAHRLIEFMLGDKPSADRAVFVLLMLTLVIATFTTDLWRAVCVYLFAGVLLSSTAHPWYLLWALAFVPLAFSWGAWVLSLSIVLAYTAWLNPVEFQPLGWAVWVTYVPVYALVAYELSRWAAARLGRRAIARPRA